MASIARPPRSVTVAAVTRPARCERDDVLEQVLRVSDDVTDACAFARAAPGSRTARIALGQLVSRTAYRPRVGDPILGFVTGAAVNPAWRDRCPPRPDSAWGELELLEALYGPLAGDPLQRLLELRRRAAVDLRP